MNADLTLCKAKKHPFVVIMTKPCHDAPDAETVVRWCPLCGGVVVDVDVDGRTYAGHARPYEAPAISKVLP